MKSGKITRNVVSDDITTKPMLLYEASVIFMHKKAPQKAVLVFILLLDVRCV